MKGAKYNAWYRRLADVLTICGALRVCLEEEVEANGLDRGNSPCTGVDIGKYELLGDTELRVCGRKC